MKKIIITVFSILVLAGIVTTVAQPATAAIDVFEQCKEPAFVDDPICKARDEKLFGPGSLWNNILNVFTMIIGSIAVLMMIIGGLRYTTSAGDSTQITAAKNTILYAAVGIVIAAMSGALVNFVLVNV